MRFDRTRHKFGPLEVVPDESHHQIRNERDPHWTSLMTFSENRHEIS